MPLLSLCDPHELASWVKRIDGYRRRKVLPPMSIVSPAARGGRGDDGHRGLG